MEVIIAANSFSLSNHFSYRWLIKANIRVLFIKNHLKSLAVHEYNSKNTTLSIFQYKVNQNSKFQMALSFKRVIKNMSEMINNHIYLV